MTLWRFDQGRLDYLQFDEIKRIALALTAFQNRMSMTTFFDKHYQITVLAHLLQPITLCGAITDGYLVVYYSQLRLREESFVLICAKHWQLIQTK